MYLLTFIQDAEAPEICEVWHSPLARCTRSREVVCLQCEGDMLNA